MLFLREPIRRWRRSSPASVPTRTKERELALTPMTPSSRLAEVPPPGRNATCAGDNCFCAALAHARRRLWSTSFSLKGGVGEWASMSSVASDTGGVILPEAGDAERQRGWHSS